MMPALLPLSAVYRMVSSSHRLLYRFGFLKSRKLPRPVISVGNISVGGSGKTPLVIWLANHFAGRGFRVVVLTRGYGREMDSGTDVKVIKDINTRDARSLGDEPLLISKRVPSASVYVAADRYQAGMKALEEEEVDLFLLDDGFQHFALKRDLDVVTVDGRRRFGNGRLLPAGFLREPLSRLMEADIVVVTKSGDVDEEFKQVLGCMTNAPVCWSDYRTTDIVRLNDGAVQRTDGLTGEKFLLFSGIADPDSFEETVRDLPIEISDKVRFPDHHFFSKKDVRDLYEMAERSGATALLTTEKDGYRWRPEASTIPCYVLTMDPVFLAGEEILLKKVLSLVKSN